MLKKVLTDKHHRDGSAIHEFGGMKLMSVGMELMMTWRGRLTIQGINHGPIGMLMMSLGTMTTTGNTKMTNGNHGMMKLHLWTIPRILMRCSFKRHLHWPLRPIRLWHRPEMLSSALDKLVATLHQRACRARANRLQAHRREAARFKARDSLKRVPSPTKRGNLLHHV